MISPGQLLDRYELVRQLASGGMGEIYLARLHGAAGFDSLVAIKVLMSNFSTKPTFVRMFLDEARNVARLRHANIVQIHDIELHENQYYMTMEYIRGQNLRELIGDVSILDTPLFPPKLGASLFADLASALGAVHDAGLVHRDLSPNNIMIGDDGVPKLIDFGVARALGEASLTTPGTLKGKFTYMAPEYVRGEPYDHRIDIFSFGVVMWETFTRRRLFRGTNAAEQLHQVLEAKPIPRLDDAVAGFPTELADVVAGMVERDPNRRLDDARMIADRLHELSRSFTEAGDGTLKRWLARRLHDRIEERRLCDLQSLERPGDPIIVEARSTGTSGSVFPQTRAGPQGIAPTGSTSIRIANGEAVSNHTATEASARGRRAMYVIAAAGIVVLALVAGIALRSGPATSSDLARPPAAPTVGEGERRRQAGLDALEAKDYPRALSELAEAIRLGVRDPSVLQLMELARRLKRDPAGANHERGQTK